MLWFTGSASMLCGLGSFVAFQDGVGNSDRLGQLWQLFWPLGDQGTQSLPCQMLAERPWVSHSASVYLSSTLLLRRYHKHGCGSIWNRNNAMDFILTSRQGLGQQAVNTPIFFLACARSAGLLWSLVECSG